MKIILLEITLRQTSLSFKQMFLQRPENINVKWGSRHNTLCNSSVTFVTHKRFAVLFSLPSCCVNSLILTALHEVRQVTNIRTICEAFNKTPVTKTLLGEVQKLLQMYMTVENLSKDVFHRLSSTGSDTFYHLTCLKSHQNCAAKCLFSYKEDLPKIWVKPSPKDAKPPLPVDVHRA